MSNPYKLSFNDPGLSAIQKRNEALKAQNREQLFSGMRNLSSNIFEKRLEDDDTLTPLERHNRRIRFYTGTGDSAREAEARTQYGAELKYERGKEAAKTLATAELAKGLRTRASDARTKLAEMQASFEFSFLTDAQKQQAMAPLLTTIANSERELKGLLTGTETKAPYTGAGSLNYIPDQFTNLKDSTSFSNETKKRIAETQGMSAENEPALTDFAKKEEEKFSSWQKEQSPAPRGLPTDQILGYDTFVAQLQKEDDELQKQSLLKRLVTNVSNLGNNDFEELDKITGGNTGAMLLDSIQEGRWVPKGEKYRQAVINELTLETPPEVLDQVGAAFNLPQGSMESIVQAKNIDKSGLDMAIDVTEAALLLGSMTFPPLIIARGAATIPMIASKLVGKAGIKNIQQAKKVVKKMVGNAKEVPLGPEGNIIVPRASNIKRVQGGKLNTIPNQSSLFTF